MLKKTAKVLMAIIIIFCLVFTTVSLAVVATNFNNIGHFVQSVVLIDKFFLWPTERETMIEGMIHGVVGSLDDRYSRYLPPERYQEFRESFSGTYGGIGIYADFVDDAVIVVSTMPDSPGEEAGLQENDAIIGVDGENVTGMSINDIIDMIRGEAGTEVVLTIRRGEQEVFDVSITREQIDSPTIRAEMLEEAPEIGYLRISVFTQRTFDEFAEKMNELLQNDPQGLIIDLRSNPGGDLESFVNVTGSFTPEGPVLHQVNKAGETRSIVTSGNTFDFPIVVLTNSNTASAAEAMTGALQDNEVAFVIGETTFGKGIVQTIFPLGNGGGLELTTDQYLTPLKRNIHDVGITPDLVVELTSEDTEDTQLQAAISHLQDQLQ